MRRSRRVVASVGRDFDKGLSAGPPNALRKNCDRAWNRSAGLVAKPQARKQPAVNLATTLSAGGQKVTQTTFYKENQFH